MPRKTQQQLDPLTTINAYAQGIFPMADHDGTIHWYAPDPRAILEHHNLHISAHSVPPYARISTKYAWIQPSKP